MQAIYLHVASKPLLIRFEIYHLKFDMKDLFAYIGFLFRSFVVVLLLYTAPNHTILKNLNHVNG